MKEHPRQNTVLIENGILRGYMQDKLNARLMGVEPTGNGRRESFAHIPMPRMTNTYMLAGKHDPAEIIASVDKGLYAPNFGGGQVDITSGKFVFSASEAYLIENGKVTTPVKGAMLIGDGPEALQQDLDGRQRPRSSTRVLAPAARKGSRCRWASASRRSRSMSSRLVAPPRFAAPKAFHISRKLRDFTAQQCEIPHFNQHISGVESRYLMEGYDDGIREHNYRI